MADFPRNPLEKDGYILEFNDDFDDIALDTEKWVPYYLPQWSSREQSRPRYTLADSALVLQIEANQPPWCPEFDGDVKVSSIQTGLFAGPVGSQIGQHQFKPNLVVREAQPTIRTYTPQYGYFEARVKTDNRPGSMAALWMIGFEEQPERSGEIAVFELFADQMTAVTSEVRYGVHPWGDPTLRDAYFREVLPMDATEYHIYAIEWTPDHIDFYVDNLKRQTVRQSVTYPMQFMLGMYELPGEGVTPQEQGREFVIDYLRGYQPVRGY
ncbi:MAG: glycoside hydrolase family 16 protein [Anaerolineae bacterium]|nr:glycoside hydrolase family 16 protein [Anaerolineae bacterium]